MPAIARLRTYGQHAWRDRDRLVECLRNGDPFYMASITGGPATPEMNPSMGRIDPEIAASIRFAVRHGVVDYIIWSYDTPIAWHVSDSLSNRWVMSTRRYSPTTTQHQGIIRSAIATLEG